MAMLPNAFPFYARVVHVRDGIRVAATIIYYEVQNRLGPSMPGLETRTRCGSAVDSTRLDSASISTLSTPLSSSSSLFLLFMDCSQNPLRLPSCDCAPFLQTTTPHAHADRSTTPSVLLFPHCTTHPPCYIRLFSPLFRVLKTQHASFSLKESSSPSVFFLLSFSLSVCD